MRIPKASGRAHRDGRCSAPVHSGFRRRRCDRILLPSPRSAMKPMVAGKMSYTMARWIRMRWPAPRRRGIRNSRRRRIFWRASMSPTTAIFLGRRFITNRRCAFSPDNATLLIYYAATLLPHGACGGGPGLTRRHAASGCSRSAGLRWGCWCLCNLASDHTPERFGRGKSLWRCVRSLRSANILARAGEGIDAESEFSQRESNHFNLHFEAKDTLENFRRGPGRDG